MRTYTIEEAIEEMKSTVQVFSDGYGTWKVKANLGIHSTGEYVEDHFTTHDEEWKTGIFDDEKYNDSRDERAARKIVESWVDDDNTPDNVIVTADNSTIYVLDEDEKEFVESETANLAMLVDGRSKAFIDAYDNREEASSRQTRFSDPSTSGSTLSTKRAITTAGITRPTSPSTTPTKTAKKAPTRAATTSATERAAS